MSEAFSISADVQKTVKALEGTTKSVKAISKQVLNIAITDAQKYLKCLIRDRAYKTGEFLAMWKKKATSSSANLFPQAKTKQQWGWGLASILSYGDKNNHVKPRAFIQDTKSYLSAKDYSAELSKYTEKELLKYWG